MRPYNYVSYEMGGAKPTHYHYHSPSPSYSIPLLTPTTPHQLPTPSLPTPTTPRHLPTPTETPTPPPILPTYPPMQSPTQPLLPHPPILPIHRKIPSLWRFFRKSKTTLIFRLIYSWKIWRIFRFTHLTDFILFFNILDIFYGRCNHAILCALGMQCSFPKGLKLFSVLQECPVSFSYIFYFPSFRGKDQGTLWFLEVVLILEFRWLGNTKSQAVFTQCKHKVSLTPRMNKPLLLYRVNLKCDYAESTRSMLLLILRIHRL